MKLVIVNQKGSSSKVLNSEPWLIAVLFLCLAVIFISLGSLLSVYFLNKSDVVPLSKREVTRWRHGLNVQKQDLSDVRISIDRELSALAVQVGKLHGRLLRLDALGERLIVVANLKNSDEFDFSKPAALGGEEGNEAFTYQMPSFMQSLDDLASKIGRREEQLDVLEGLLLDKKFRKDTHIEGRPISRGWISSEYGYRVDPFTGKIVWHRGVDFAGKEGSEINSVGAGVVTWAGTRGGYGQMVEISHGNKLVTRYAHNRDILVKCGQIVEKGQIIGYIGSSGRSTGPHVHFEVLKNGRHVNPKGYIQ